MTLAYAFDPYAAARVAREIDLIKAANPVCYTLAGVPYVVVQTPTGIVLQKAGRQKVAPGQMSLFSAPSQPASPKMSNVGRTKMVDGITYKLNQNSRWERTDKGQAAAAKPALAVLRDEPAAASVVPPMAEAEPAGGDDAPSPYHAAMPEAEPVGEKEKPSYENMVLEAEVFRYLTAKASEKYDDSSVLRAIGDLNTRSGRDKYLMDKYGIDQSEARAATNAAESLPRLFTIGGGEVTWQNNQAAKVGIDSAPQIEDYPDIQAIVEEAVATGETMSRARAEATAANNAKPGQADLAKIPPGIASKLRASFGTVKAWNQRVNLARQTDRQFQGGGRYTWEATNGTQMEEPETLQIFRKMAPKNGIDADAALAAMGYEPPTQLMPSETNWRFASESNAAQRNAMPEPASDRPMDMPEAEPAAAEEPAGGEGMGDSLQIPDEYKEAGITNSEYKAIQKYESDREAYVSKQMTRMRIYPDESGYESYANRARADFESAELKKEQKKKSFSWDKWHRTHPPVDPIAKRQWLGEREMEVYEKQKASRRSPMTKTLSLGGARYILDGNILRKTSMEWEEFKPEADAMHKEAQGDEAKGEDDPCWKGYKAVGLKRKGKRMVPNCVPV